MPIPDEREVAMTKIDQKELEKQISLIVYGSFGNYCALPIVCPVDGDEKRKPKDICKDCVTKQLMSLIIDNCWLKGNQEVPEAPEDSQIFGYLAGQADMLKADFKPCGKWEK